MKVSLLGILPLLFLASCAFKGNTVGYISIPGPGIKEYELTDAKCPEQPPSGELYRIFWYGGISMGCYSVNNSAQTISFVIAGNRSISGQPEFSTYTFSELNKTKEIGRAATNAAILQTFGNRPQAQPVQIAPFSCIRSGAYTSCQ